MNLVFRTYSSCRCCRSLIGGSHVGWVSSSGSAAGAAASPRGPASGAAGQCSKGVADARRPDDAGSGGGAAVGKTVIPKLGGGDG